MNWSIHVARRHLFYANYNAPTCRPLRPKYVTLENPALGPRPPNAKGVSIDIGRPTHRQRKAMKPKYGFKKGLKPKYKPRKGTDRNKNPEKVWNPNNPSPPEPKTGLF